MVKTIFSGAFRVGRTTVLALDVIGPMLRSINNNANDTALDLRVQPGEAPMTVNSGTRVDGFNADALDGKDSTSFVANNTYEAENPVGAGTLEADDTRVNIESCNPGGRLLSGGPADDWNVVMLCADQ